ncbi:MAG: protease complex subunit PrcB family protein [Lachnospiraceae bacterium]|nr:protease complex subunit PrcB family protein [Lachnospiraceae bacterium]
MKQNIGRLLLFFTAFAGCVLLGCILAGCGKKEEAYVKLREPEFTVVEEADVPRELLDVIQEKKEEEFKITYRAEDGLYLAKGYGSQPSGGYSITVEELFCAKEGLCIKTKLTGPAADEKVTAAKTYPYVVIKLEPMEVKVHFLD